MIDAGWAIAERPERINYSADYPVRFQCGCTVVFLGSCFHRTTRLDACTEHDGREQFDERTRIIASAKDEYALATALQPPL